MFMIYQPNVYLSMIPFKLRHLIEGGAGGFVRAHFSYIISFHIKISTSYEAFSSLCARTYTMKLGVI